MKSFIATLTALALAVVIGCTGESDPAPTTDTTPMDDAAYAAEMQGDAPADDAPADAAPAKE